MNRLRDMYYRILNDWNRIGLARLFSVIVAIAALPSIMTFEANFQFVNIVDDSGPFDQIGFGGASINKSDTVTKLIADR